MKFPVSSQSELYRLCPSFVECWDAIPNPTANRDQTITFPSAFYERDEAKISHHYLSGN